MTTLPACREIAEPRPLTGAYEYRIRTAFRDLCRIYGFENARATVAEIINDEADRRAS